MDTILINSRNSKKFNPHKLLIKVSDKLGSKRSNKYVVLS